MVSLKSIQTVQLFLISCLMSFAALISKIHVEKEIPGVNLPANTPLEMKPKLRYDSSDATVIAMAHGYDLKTHQRFVGSLRKSNFTGTIIMATEKESKMKAGVREYLRAMNVTTKELTFVPCDKPIYEKHEVKGKKEREGNTCIHPYPDIKVRWGRYPFLRDALRDCEQCTGPVLFADVRDTIFQRDPFGDGVPEVKGLQFFGEHTSATADHWFVARRVRICKHGFKMNGPMLCSGTTIGDRNSMLEYLELMYQEMKQWMVEEQCLFKSHGGDQAIMNYLYYAGKFESLNPEVFMPKTGIVNTVGVIGIQITKMGFKLSKKYKGSKSFIFNEKSNPWLSPQFDQTNEDGYFIDVNGERSRVVHQYDRFGNAAINWVDRAPIYDKDIPTDNNVATER